MRLFVVVVAAAMIATYQGMKSDGTPRKRKRVHGTVTGSEQIDGLVQSAWSFRAPPLSSKHKRK